MDNSSMDSSKSLYESLYDRQKNRGQSYTHDAYRLVKDTYQQDAVFDHKSESTANNQRPSSASVNEDFFRGFYEGTLTRHDSASPASLQSRFRHMMTSYVAPMLANSLLFFLPLIYMRYRMDKKFADTFPFSTFKRFFPQGFKAQQPTGESLMEMFNPLKPKDFEIKLNYGEGKKIITFRDVLGVDDAKKELLVYKNYIKNPEKYTRFGGKLPKGMLMIGKPGTGKTMLMKAFVNECNRHVWEIRPDSRQGDSLPPPQQGKVALFSAVGSDFIELYGGSGPKRVRELFNQAKKKLRELEEEAKEQKNASCAVVIFIDEIDALGCRGGGMTSDGRGVSGGISSEENRTINQILSELDGLESAENIVVVGATNNPEALDKALLREGRFDKKVHLSLPDIPARKSIFQHYLRDVLTAVGEKIDGEVNQTNSSTDRKKDLAIELAERTPGTSPAQISTIVNEAAITAAVKGATYISDNLFHNAVDDVLIGKKRRSRMSTKSTQRTSIHECGHCLAAWFSSPRLQTKVLKISLIPRGMAGGYTQQLEREENDVVTAETLFSTLCVLVGGRVAEELAYVMPKPHVTSHQSDHAECTNAWDDSDSVRIPEMSEGISTGAYDDLQRATQMAAEMITSYGVPSVDGLVSDAIRKIHFESGETSEASESLLSFPVQGKKNGRGWAPYSEAHHHYIEQRARRIIDLAFLQTRNLLTTQKDKLFALSDLLLSKKELDTSAIEQVLGPRPE